MRLSPKAVEVLICLSDNNGEVVSKETIHETVWADRIVTDAQISKAINELRSAFDDLSEPRQYIETLPKRGYRLVCTLSHNEPTEKSGEKRNRNSLLLAGLLGFAVLVIVIIFYQEGPTKETTDHSTIAATPVTAPRQPAKSDSLSKNKVDLTAMASIAVLPFTNISISPETGFFADGLSDDILDHLVQNKILNVASRSASFQFGERGEDPTIVGEALKVAYLLEGSVRQQDDRHRITAQLIRTKDGFHVWSKSYERTLEDGFGMQTTVAANIANVSQSELGFDVYRNYGWKQDRRYADIDPLAVEHFVNARNETRKINLGEGGDWETELQFLKNAVETDPGFYSAYVSLAGFYFKSHRQGRIFLQEARPAAHMAIANARALAPDNPGIQYNLAQVNLLLDLDYATAETAFKRFLTINPKSRIWLYYLSDIALREGRTSEVLRRLANILEFNTLAELQAVSLAATAWIRCVGGEYEAAIQASTEGLQLSVTGRDRADNLRMYALSLIMSGRVEEAKPLVEEAWNLERTTYPERYVSLFAYIGDSERSKNMLSDPRLNIVNNFHLAMAHLALGDVDNTFKFIEAGIENHNPYLIGSLIAAEWWNPIRDDPRFNEMLQLLDSKVTHTEQYLRDHKITQPDQ